MFMLPELSACLLNHPSLCADLFCVFLLFTQCAVETAHMDIQNNWADLESALYQTELDKSDYEHTVRDLERSVTLCRSVYFFLGGSCLCLLLSCRACRTWQVDRAVCESDEFGFVKLILLKDGKKAVMHSRGN